MLHTSYPVSTRQARDLAWQCESAPEPGCCVEQVVVGTACADSRHMLDISYPVSNGQVQDWDAMERVWDHTFEHVLNLDAAARARTNILLTEPPLNPLSNRQAQIFPHCMRPCGLHASQVPCVLVLYCSGDIRLCYRTNKAPAVQGENGGHHVSEIWVCRGAGANPSSLDPLQPRCVDLPVSLYMLVLPCLCLIEL